MQDASNAVNTTAFSLNALIVFFQKEFKLSDHDGQKSSCFFLQDIFTYLAREKEQTLFYVDILLPVAFFLGVHGYHSATQASHGSCFDLAYSIRVKLSEKETSRNQSTLFMNEYRRLCQDMLGKDDLSSSHFEFSMKLYRWLVVDRPCFKWPCCSTYRNYPPYLSTSTDYRGIDIPECSVFFDRLLRAFIASLSSKKDSVTSVFEGAKEGVPGVSDAGVNLELDAGDDGIAGTSCAVDVPNKHHPTDNGEQEPDADAQALDNGSQKPDASCQTFSI